MATTGVRKIAIILVNYQDDQKPARDQHNSEPGADITKPILSRRLLWAVLIERHSFWLLAVAIVHSGKMRQRRFHNHFQCENAGIDLSPFDSYVFLGKTPSTCSGSYGSVLGNPGIVVGAVTIQVTQPLALTNLLAHEVGHNLGLTEATSIKCDS